MNYSEYRYLWPPRPEKKIAHSSLAFYETRGFWSQKKKNGTCSLIFCNGHEVIYKTRHDTDHKMWSPLSEHNRFFSGRNGWNVYVAELLHSKVTNGPKNEFYIFDILVSDGQYLVGSTFSERQHLLHDRWDGEDEGDQIRINEHVTLAVCENEGFSDLYSNLKREDEGLVLKDPRAKLLPCYKADSNNAWMVKCRIPQKNYSF